MNPFRRIGGRVQRQIRGRRIAVASAVARAPTILCPSIGRVGSTMLWDALIEGRARSLLGSFKMSDREMIGSRCWDLGQNSIKAATICKTHDLPYDLHSPQPLRIMFLFGTPSDAVLSVMRRIAVRGSDWGDRHLRHMHASGTIADALDRDILRIEEQIDAWRSVRQAPLLAIHCDALWTCQDELDDFVGYSVPLPLRIPRRFDDLDPELVARVRRSYARLDGKVAGLQPCFRSA